MRIESLQLRDFRNIEEALLHPSEGFNLICGPNGHGKTNLLEAIHVLSTLRSFRTHRNRELLRTDVESAMVRGLVDRADQRRDLCVEVHRRGKKVLVNDKGITSLRDFFGLLNCIVFTPEDIRLFRGSPSERRLSLDRLIFQASPAYAEEHRRFERVLRQRNQVLKEKRVDPKLLEVYDVQFSQCAVPLIVRRSDWIEKLQGPLKRAFQAIFGEAHEPELRYRTDVAGGSPIQHRPDELQRVLLEQLSESREVDERRGFTTRGPHRDDLDALLDGFPARERASQGQHRSLVLALKVSEIELLEEQFGHPPILLLDDVSSELDSVRTSRFFNALIDVKSQVFITSTDPGYIPVTCDSLYQVCHGVITEHPS